MVALGIQYKIVLSCHFNLIWRENGGQSTGLCRFIYKTTFVYFCSTNYFVLYDGQKLFFIILTYKHAYYEYFSTWWLFNFEQLWKFVCRSVGIRVVVDSSSRHSRSRVSSIWPSTSCWVEHLAFDQLRYDELWFEELSGSRHRRRTNDDDACWSGWQQRCAVLLQEVDDSLDDSSERESQLKAADWVATAFLRVLLQKPVRNSPWRWAAINLHPRPPLAQQII